MTDSRISGTIKRLFALEKLRLLFYDLAIMSEKEFLTHQEFGKLKEISVNLQKRFLEIRSFLDANPHKKAEYGQLLGRLLFDKLEAAYSSKDKLDDNEIKQVEEIYRYYKEMLGANNFLPIKNGFLSEFAVAKSISTDAGFKVYIPHKEEDLYGKIDLWIDLENDNSKNIIGLQIKCLSGVDKPLIINPNSRDELKTFDDKFGHLVKNSVGFDINIQKMREYLSQYDNTDALLVILPSPESEHAVFNAVNGKPNRQLGEYFYEEFDKRFMREEVLV